MGASKELTPVQAKFVAEYLKHGDGAAAARASGYTGKSPKSKAYQLLHTCENVKSAIADARKALVTQGKYNLIKAMEEADDVIAFAKEHKNPNAYVKAVELKAKLNGLLIERHDMKMTGFHVSVAGIDFSKRDKVESDETDVTDTGEDLLNE